MFRDSGLYFTYLPLLLLGAIVRRERKKSWRSFIPIVEFALPVAFIVAGYTTFNWYRTGVAFFGLTGVANWLRPVFDMARYGYAHPFRGNDIVSAVMRDQPHAYGFIAQLKFPKILHRRCTCNPIVMQSIVFHKYLVTVFRHPFAYLAVIWRNFNYLGLSSLLADPVSTADKFAVFGIPGGHHIFPGLSMRHLVVLYRHFSFAYLAFMILATISKTVSAVLFTVFVLGVPYFAYKTWRTHQNFDVPLRLACFCWFGFMTFSLAFSMIHYEARHALPILPLGMTGVAYGLWHLRGRRTRIRG